MNLKIIKNRLKPFALSKINGTGMPRRAMFEIRQNILKKLLIRTHKERFLLNETNICTPSGNIGETSSATCVAEHF
jgi:hypothetical protein